jgi:hypothetical protein
MPQADFQSLFSGTLGVTPDAGAAEQAVPAPASASVGPTKPFEGSPWEKDVRNTSIFGTVTECNSTQFATAPSAEYYAHLLGGTVEEHKPMYFDQTVPVRSIVCGEVRLNAGLVADLFNKYGEQPGSEAWNVIGRDLGLSEGSKA